MVSIKIDNLDLTYTKEFAQKFIDTYDKLIDGLSKNDRKKILFGRYRPFSVQIQYGIRRGFAILLVPMPDRREEFEYLIREDELILLIRGQSVQNTGDGTVRLENENGSILIYSSNNSRGFLSEELAKKQAELYFKQDAEKAGIKK